MKPTYPLVKVTGQVDDSRFLRTLHVKRLWNRVPRRASSSMTRGLCRAHGPTEHLAFMYSFPPLGLDRTFRLACDLFFVSLVISTKSLFLKPCGLSRSLISLVGFPPTWWCKRKGWPTKQTSNPECCRVRQKICPDPRTIHHDALLGTLKHTVQRFSRGYVFDLCCVGTFDDPTRG